MSGLSDSTVYRGKAGCLPPKERKAKSSGGGRRGGTVGAGTRQGTRRTHLEELAYRFDADGVQLAALEASINAFFDERVRAQLCATADGRHSSGLILMRPRRLSCTQTLCRCNADTFTMACRLGFGAQPLALQRWWSTNKKAREVKLKKARDAVEPEAVPIVAGPSYTPVGQHDPAASPMTTHIDAAATTDATDPATPRQPALASKGGAAISPSA